MHQHPPTTSSQKLAGEDGRVAQIHAQLMWLLLMKPSCKQCSMYSMSIHLKFHSTEPALLW